MKAIEFGWRFVIVSTDQDLWQLLSGDRVTVWNPRTKKMLTEQAFRERWGIGPSQWADVKAIAGCPGDGVPGVPGVGEKTAAKFMAGRLKDTTKAYNRVVEANDLWERNLRLVRLSHRVHSIDVGRRSARHLSY